MAGHDNEGGQNVMGKTCHKHVVLMLYVRNNKIRRWRVMKTKKKKVSILFHFFWPKVLRKKEGALASCLAWKRIRRRFGHTCV